MSIKLVTANTVDSDALVNLFNVAYSDYLVPIYLSSTQLQQTIGQNAIDLAASYVSLDGDNLVGMGFLAHRDIRGWIGGMGVVPSHRHMGIGRQLMGALLESARERRLDTVQLEVIEGNIPAYNLYVDLGFETIRRLLVVQRPELPAPIRSETDSPLSIKPVPLKEALTHYEYFHSVPNPWQREHASLLRANDLTGWLAERENRPAAYIIGRVTSHMIQIMDAAFDEGEQLALLALVAHLHQQTPRTPGSMVNLPENDPAFPVFRDLHYEETMAQIEMVYRLSEQR